MTNIEELEGTERLDALEELKENHLELCEFLTDNEMGLKKGLDKVYLEKLWNLVYKFYEP